MGRISAYRRVDGHNFCLLVIEQARGRMETSKESGDEPGNSRLRLGAFGRGSPWSILRGYVQRAAAEQAAAEQASAEQAAAMQGPIEPLAAHFKCRCAIFAKAADELGPRFACQHNRMALAQGWCVSFVPLSTRSLSYARLK